MQPDIENPESDNHDYDPRKYWPWVAAAFALAGIIVFIFATHGPPASSSGFVSTLKGAIGSVAPEYVKENPHYSMIPGPGSWLYGFVVGMAAGGFIAGRLSCRRINDVPAIWKQRIGSSPWKRYLATFASGFMILFASRLAGGCTLGLFISGSTQLAISGLYFGALIFGVAMITARFVYGSGQGEEAKK